MATVVVINPDAADPMVRLKGAIADKRSILEQIGALMEAESQEAFARQRLGDIRWEPRYPNQGDPFINVAGAVSDFAKGATEPRSRRYQRRPAAMDTGEMQNSVRSRVVDDESVEVGSNLKRAPFHQFGLVSTQEVTQEMKNAIARFLLSDRGAQYREKLSFLTLPNTNRLDTEIVARPFLGVTPELEEDIPVLVEEHLGNA